MDYIKRLKISIQGCKDLEFYSSSELIAKGYNRIVIGKRGPYVEFEKQNFLDFKKLVIPETEKWRLKRNSFVYYIEYRIYPEKIKVYFQKRVVDYADYKIGKFYISPFDLYLDNKNLIIET